MSCDPGAQVQARIFQQCGAEPQAQRRVVVPAGDDHVHAGGAQPHQRVVEELHRVHRGQCPVVDVAGDQQQVHLPDLDRVHKAVDEVLLGTVQRGLVEGAAQVPVGGVQDTHATNISDPPPRVGNRPGAAPNN